jgi:phosphorylcholine metabolism protein LicD
MCIENNSKAKIDQNFAEVIKLLNSNNIHYWLCHGTLLGVIRDNDLIPWDHDIDIAVWYNKKLKFFFINLMKENNFQLKEKYLIEDDLITFTKSGGREVDINFYEKKILNNKQFAYIKWFVPKNLLMKFIEAISMSSTYSGKFKFIINKLSFFESIFEKIKIFLIKKKYFHKSIGYTQPLKLLEKFKKIKFNSVSVSVPYFSEEYLEYVYGPDWKKPIRKYNWIKDSPSTKQV